MIENGYSCTMAVPNVCTPVCNDGKVVGTETCDDGTGNGEGCNPTCNGNVTGWNCTGGGPFSPSNCQPICGDGYRVTGEGCDDGTKLDGTGCKADCSGPMLGYYCTGGGPLSIDVCTEKCADGYPTHTEACDDGFNTTWQNMNGGDGCNETCTVEVGWTCTNWTTGAYPNPSVCTPICGDGYIVGNEKCDDKNLPAGSYIGCFDDCSGNFTGYYCYVKSWWNITTICPEMCGDGIKT